jgi:hypothetical protein
VGVLVRRRLGLPTGAFVALAVSTVALAGLQSYGGEIFLRTYLFSLPAVVLFAAAPIALLKFPALLRGTLIAALSVTLLMLFIFVRYGEARVDYLSPQEFRAMKSLYRIAPHGSLLLAGEGNLPWRFRAYDDYGYSTVDDLKGWKRGTTGRKSVERVAAQIVQKMASQPGPAYLIFMRSMEPGVAFADPRRAGKLPRVERAIRRLGLFRVIYHNEDASIYVLKGSTSPTTAAK